MYENSSWPIAYTLKDEVKFIVSKFKEMLDGVLQDIEKSERKD